MKFTLTASSLCVILAVAASAEDIALVMEVSGAVEYRETANDDFKTLEPNTTLDADDFIRTHEQGAVTLLYLDTNTPVKIQSMEGLSVGSRKPEARPQEGLLARALKSLVGDDDIGDNAATRGLGDITMLSPTESKVAGNAVALVWEGGMGSRPFNVTLTGADGAELMNQQVTDRKIDIDLDAAGINPGTTVTWSVNMDRAGPQYAKGGTFTRVSKDDAQGIEVEIDAILTQYEALSDSVVSAAIGLHLASRSYYFAAFEALERASAAAEDPTAYDAIIEALLAETNAE